MTAFFGVFSSTNQTILRLSSAEFTYGVLPFRIGNHLQVNLALLPQAASLMQDFLQFEYPG
jgi:hypothetical protein